MSKKEIEVNGVLIRLSKVNDSNYISITDIAKKYGEPSALISSWLRNMDTLDYLGLWESLENDNFNSLGFEGIKKQAGRNKFYLSAKQWVAKTNAIGIKTSAGRYSKGTLAQEDIALNFCYWLEPTFQLYMIREFKRLKIEEELKLGDPYNIKRHLTSGNYSLLVSAILSQTDERLLTHPQPYKGRLPIASESDLLNQIVFGNTAKEWRLHNTDKPVDRNQRDYASVLDLTILNNLEFLDSMLLQWDCGKEERKAILKEAYDFQYPILKRSKTIQKIQELANRVR